MKTPFELSYDVTRRDIVKFLSVGGELYTIVSDEQVDPDGALVSNSRVFIEDD